MVRVIIMNKTSYSRKANNAAKAANETTNVSNFWEQVFNQPTAKKAQKAQRKKGGKTVEPKNEKSLSKEAKKNEREEELKLVLVRILAGLFAISDALRYCKKERKALTMEEVAILNEDFQEGTRKIAQDLKCVIVNTLKSKKVPELEYDDEDTVLYI